MRLGCDKRCPKVREQLKKAREEGREETDDEDSSSSGPSAGQKIKNGSSKRSKQSGRYPTGAASPTKTVGSPQRSQHTLARGSPVRSQRRSKESQRSRGYPPGRVDPGRSADPSRRLDPEQRSAEKKKTAASPKSRRNGRYEDDDEERAGPSRKTGSRKKGGTRDDEASEDHRQKWPSGAHDRCGPHCRARDERMRRSENEKQRREADDYILHKNLPYFEDLCSCCYGCLTNQLWKDRFFKSTVASVAVFALGLKLCCDLDGWTIPNPL